MSSAVRRGPKSGNSLIGTVVHPESLNVSEGAGGIEVWIRDFLYFAKEKYRVVSPTAPNSQFSNSEQTKHDVLSVSIHHSSRAVLPKALRFALKLLTRRKWLVGVLIIHRIELVWVLRMVRPRAPIVLVIHTDLLAQKSLGETSWRGIPKKIYFSYEKWALSSAQIVLSQASSDFARVTRLASRAHLLRGWYNDEVFFMDRSTRRENIVLWVGRLEHTKNPFLALEAFSQSNLLGDFRLVFIGGGSLRDRLENEVLEMGLADHIQFAGTLSPDRVASFFHRSKLLIHTSLFEATPKIFLEAMACGVHVVASEQNDPEQLCLTVNLGSWAAEYTVGAYARALEQSIAVLDSRKLNEAELRARGASQNVRAIECLLTSGLADDVVDLRRNSQRQSLLTAE